MMTEVQLNDVTLWVEYNFYDGEEQDYNYVGSPPSVDLHSIYVGTQDIYNLLDANQLEEIENILIKNHREQ